MPLHPLHLRALTPTLHHTPQHQGRAPVSRLNVPTPFLSLARRVNQKPTSSSSSCLHPPAAPCPRCPAPAEPTPPPATPTTKRRGRTKTDPSPRIAAKPPTLPVLAHHPHPAKPWHLRISTRGTHYRSHFITATDDPQHHLFSPHPKPVSWSLHHTPCLAARLCSPPDLTTRTTHPRSPTYPGVNHHTCTYLLISAITTRSSRTPPPPNAAKPPTPPSPGISTRGTRPINPCRLHPFLLPRGKPKNHRPLQPLPAEPTA